MKSHIAAIAVALAVVFAVSLHAAEPSGDTGKAQSKTLTITAGSEELTDPAGGQDCRVIRTNEGGKKKVIKIKGGGPLDLDDGLDTETHLKLLDARIGYLKATSQLKTDLAVKRLEVKKLELAKKPDAEVLARKNEVNALKARLADAELDHEQAVKKLVPEGMHELYMLGIGDESSLLDLSLDLPTGIKTRIIRKILVDEDKEDDD